MISRRRFLGGMTLVGGSLVADRSRWAAAEPPPETTRIKLNKFPVYGNCLAPLYAAEELLQGEGFTEVQYVNILPPGGAKTLTSGEVDIGMSFLPTLITAIDADAPLVILAGGHAGCTELVATDRIRSIRDLKGKTVGVPSIGPQAAAYVFAASFVATVGLHPQRDVNFVVRPFAESAELLARGEIDAVPVGPPESFELRSRKIGHVLVNNGTDRPWSKYFCCMIFGNRDFVQKHPVATKRVVRAIVKSSGVCALEPERVARFMVDKGYTDRFEHALATVRELPYGRWREYDAEDSVRFYALRLHEVGMIKASPQKIIAQGTDWRFLDELKKELKG